MPGCKCAGQTCSCSITAGTGTTVRGTGTAADPFKIDVDPSSLAMASLVKATGSATLDLRASGAGSLVDPLVITGRVLLYSPSGTKYTLAVSDGGALSTVATT